MDETLIISESQGQGSLDQKTVRDFFMIIDKADGK